MAMSGGVDSSVAAAILHQQGYEVVGVTLHLWDYPIDGGSKGRCCAPEDIHDARRVADKLGIPHYAFDRRELFLKEVVEPFVEAYLDGTTPSPCVRCNRGVKARELFALAERLDAKYIATGHYARLLPGADGPELHRAKDGSKDQSYFLHMIPPADLSKMIFPLGEMTKREVRALAHELELPGAAKGESQELCFIADGRYDGFVEARADGKLRPGRIISENGSAIAEHGGIHRYTIGQRRNLGVAVGHRTYVVGLDAKSGDVTLGTEEELYSKSAQLGDDFYLTEGLELPIEAKVMVRYRGTPHQANIYHNELGVIVDFIEPVRAVVPGQVAVFLHDERVVGGGTIIAAKRVTAKGSELNEAEDAHTEKTVDLPVLV